MRSRNLVLVAAFLTACGGNKATDGAKAPDNFPTDGGVASAAPPSTDAGPTTTTTATLGDGGDLQGAKLTQTTTIATDAGASAATSGDAGKAPHTHDPGRGIMDIQAIVQAHRDEARACYCRTAKKDPSIKGDLVVQWTIDPKGNVSAASVDAMHSQITDATVTGCVMGIVKKIKFAESPGGYETKANYPFKFVRKCDANEGQ
jgi:hypothetical protein